MYFLKKALAFDQSITFSQVIKYNSLNDDLDQTNFFLNTFAYFLFLAFGETQLWMML